ncbi:MAG: hypothetical protein WBA28_04795 [Microbacteriaceae bacterium]
MTNLIVAATELGHGLPMPAEAYGFIAAAIFGLLLVLTMSFSGVSHRHNNSGAHNADHADSHGGSTGSGH